VTATLAAQLRALADRVDDLEPARVVGELEALKFEVWTAAARATPTGPPLEAAGPMPEHLTTKAAADWLGISPTALRRFEADGQLAAIRIGRRVVFRRDTLDRFRADRERVSPGRWEVELHAAGAVTRFPLHVP
jgi:excisionase family DNA binding protein